MPDMHMSSLHDLRPVSILIQGRTPHAYAYHMLIVPAAGTTAPQVRAVASRRADTVCISGLTGEGVEQLLAVIGAKLDAAMTQVCVFGLELVSLWT